MSEKFFKRLRKQIDREIKEGILDPRLKSLAYKEAKNIFRYILTPKRNHEKV